MASYETKGSVDADRSMTADGGKYQEKSFPYELCPGCDEMKQEEVYGRSFTPALETKSSSCPSGKCASAS